MLPYKKMTDITITVCELFLSWFFSMQFALLLLWLSSSSSCNNLTSFFKNRIAALKMYLKTVENEINFIISKILGHECEKNPLSENFRPDLKKSLYFLNTK